MTDQSPPPREYEFDLPVGLTDADGEIHRDAAVRKMRGHEEALLYDQDLGPGELVSHMIAGTLVRLGTLDRPGPDVAGRMYSADRNYLLLQIRRVTLGDEMTASYTCPACAAEVRTIERLDEIPVRRLQDGEDPEAITVELEDGFTDRNGTTHGSVTLRLPRGDDEAFVSPSFERDPMKAADALTLRCVSQFGTLPLNELEAYGLRILRDLSFGDRLRIQWALNDDAPGARLRRTVRCDACGTRFERFLDVTDFFVPSRGGDTASGRRCSTSPTTSIGPGARS
jgi:hypothetical protein